MGSGLAFDAADRRRAATEELHVALARLEAVLDGVTDAINAAAGAGVDLAWSAQQLRALGQTTSANLLDAINARRLARS